MSLVFFGTPDFAVPSLLALLTSGETVSLVVTQPDKRKGRERTASPPPVKRAASEEGLRVLQPQSLNDSALVLEIKALAPEFVVVVAYGKILPKMILDIPLRGCVNVHASLLPKYRGAAPIAWAIVRGEEETGVTTMLMDEGLDTGPTLLREELPIGPHDTAATLGEKLAGVGASLLVRTLQGLRRGSVKPVEQAGESSYAPPLKKDDGIVNWALSAREISDFVRGMQPWPGAHTRLAGETVRLLRVKPLEGEGLPGRIERVSRHELVIGTGGGLISIIELQPRGKKAMVVSAFLQGRKLSDGLSVV